MTLFRLVIQGSAGSPLPARIATPTTRSSARSTSAAPEARFQRGAQPARVGRGLERHQRSAEGPMPAKIATDLGAWASAACWATVRIEDRAGRGLTRCRVGAGGALTADDRCLTLPTGRSRVSQGVPPIAESVSSGAGLGRVHGTDHAVQRVIGDRQGDGEPVDVHRFDDGITPPVGIAMQRVVTATVVAVAPSRAAPLRVHDGAQSSSGCSGPSASDPMSRSLAVRNMSTASMAGVGPAP